MPNKVKVTEPRVPEGKSNDLQQAEFGFLTCALSMAAIYSGQKWSSVRSLSLESLRPVYVDEHMTLCTGEIYIQKCWLNKRCMQTIVD